MAKKEGRNAGAPRLATALFVFRLISAASLLVGGLYAWHKTEQFLIRDARFALALPDYGLESSSLTVTGLQYAARLQVLRIFANDFGRSLYLVPVQQRRKELRDIDWVRDASVARIWPNRLMVQIVEREPAAFIKVRGDAPGTWRLKLIDGDGVILEQPAQARFALPVATGITETQGILDRKARVHRLQTLTSEVGEANNRLISEIDVSDPDDVRVTARAGDRALVLLIGDHNFGKRFQNFVSYHPKIQKHLATARVLDLRLEDRITVVESGK